MILGTQEGDTAAMVVTVMAVLTTVVMAILGAEVVTVEVVTAANEY